MARRYTQAELYEASVTNAGGYVSAAFLKGPEVAYRITTALHRNSAIQFIRELQFVPEGQPGTGTSLKCHLRNPSIDAPDALVVHAVLQALVQIDDIIPGYQAQADCRPGLFKREPGPAPQFKVIILYQ